MKKKIINGILMVAMLFAATTSFVSCKDNVDDELIPVYAELAKQKNDLAAQITSIQNQINDLKAMGDQIEKNRVAIQNLENTVDGLQSQLDTINNQISTLSADVDTIKAQLDDMEEDIEDLQLAVTALADEILALHEKIDKLITGIAINHTLNNVTGSVNLPGGLLKMNALCAFFGSNETGIVQFPNTDEDAVVIGEALTAAEVAPALAVNQEYNFDPDTYITQEHGNAGMVFFTVNTEDPSLFDISEYTLSVRNSVGRTAPIEFTDVKPSSYQIQTGIYKSGYVDTDEDLAGDPYYYQARANIARKDLEASKFNLTKFFNPKDFKDKYKAAIDEIKAAEGKTAKVKAIVLTVAQFLRDIYGDNMSGDNKNILNPSWSAQALVLSKEVDGETIMKRTDDFNLAVSAVAPLSYNSFWEMEGAFNLDTSALENAIAKLAEKIKQDLGAGSATTFPEITAISTDGMKALVQATDDPTAAPAAALWVDLPQQIVDAINNGLQIEDLNEALQNASQVADLGSKVDNLTARFNSFIERVGNKIVSLMHDHMLTRGIAPIVLFNTTEGVQRLASGRTVKAGIMQINVTSATEELLVPAYAKYVALFDADGNAVQANVYNGSEQRFDIDLSKAGQYKLIVSCVDYYGFVINKKYDITVE